MKKLLSILLALMMCAGIGKAENALYSIRELPTHTKPVWQQTYHAHGREITVDEVIQIPDVEKAPVLRVTSMAPLADDVLMQWRQSCTDAGKQDKSNAYHFVYKPGYRVYFSQHRPSIYGGTEYQLGRMTQERAGLFEYDPAMAYADNNSLTVAEAFETAQTAVHRLYPNETLHLRNVAIYDRVYDQQRKIKLGEKGYYMLECTQTFFGIPYMASVYNTFVQKGLDTEWSAAQELGTIHVHVWDENSYDVNIKPFSLQEIVQDDMPLLPFDAVKSQVEELIQAGYIRWVDSVSLGYVQYATEAEREYLLVPSWVIWCEYVKDGPEEDPTASLYEDSAFYHNERFVPIMINAQTGIRVEPMATDAGRDRCSETGQF